MRAMVRELNARGFGNHRIAELAAVSTEQLVRLMEFGSRPDPLHERRLMAFGTGALVTKREQLEAKTTRLKLSPFGPPTAEDGRPEARQQFAM